MTTTEIFTAVCHLDDIPQKGARRIQTSIGEVALFRTSGDEVFALKNECPHKKGPLSEGIVHGHSVTCPLHGWVINFESGEAEGADSGCTPTLAVRHTVEGKILLALPANTRMDSVA